jgi:integrase
MDALTKDELERVLEHAKAARERDWLMILVAFWHGLRASEVVALTKDNFADGFLTVKRLKGSLRTTQPLVEHPDPLLNERAALSDYLLKFAAGEPLFKVGRQHFWRLFQRYAAAAELPKHKRHPHILKHTIAMQTIHSAGVENVRQYLGHKSLSSTGAYLRVDDADAARAIADATRTHLS